VAATLDEMPECLAVSNSDSTECRSYGIASGQALADDFIIDERVELVGDHTMLFTEIS
jgi:hypothetical protein